MSFEETKLEKVIFMRKIIIHAFKSIFNLNDDFYKFTRIELSFAHIELKFLDKVL